MVDGLIYDGLPEQDHELVRRMSYRWLRAAEPHHSWAKKAKQCIDFLEGRMWTEEEKAKMRAMKRTALTINKIAPLYRLIIGYQTSNRLDVTFLPTSDSRASEDVAEVLNNIYKAEANRADLQYADTDVFADGLATGRGYWDVRLCFEENELGEIVYDVADPFSKYIDPDCAHYDISHPRHGAAYVQDSVWTNLDEINEKFGSDAAMAVKYIMAPNYQSDILQYMGTNEVSPKRYFGQYADDKDYHSWSDVYMTDFIDHQAKQIRIIDSQYKMTTLMDCFMDLETGDIEPIPKDWLDKPEAIEKVMAYAEKRGNPLKVTKRPVRRVRQTITCGDIVLFDDWSIYKDYTTVGFFPYFRRGATRGMIEDLIDPAKEINKKRSVLTDILNRNANSGWIYEEGTLDADQEENLRKYGASAGIHVKYKSKGGQSEPPRRLEAGGYPQGLDRLEQKSSNDHNEISGINQSALGQLDTVQSGRAIEARQRQAVLAIQMYSDNFSRSKKIVGRRTLDVFQNFYTESRVYRIMGEDSRISTIEINKKEQTGSNAVTRINDITVGKYSVHVDEVPISATFKQAQFEETMMIIEKLGPIGMALAQIAPELIVDQTSLPRKQEWKEAMSQAKQAVDPNMQQQAGMDAGPPMPTGTPEGVSS